MDLQVDALEPNFDYFSSASRNRLKVSQWDQIAAPVQASPMETYKQFNFEAAHQTPPYSTLHGHSFVVTVHLVGEPDPHFGWSHNMYELEEAIAKIRAEVDHKYLNDVEGLEVPTLENLTKWMVEKLDAVLEGVDRVQVRRGLEGSQEGCTMRPLRRHNQVAA